MTTNAGRAAVATMMDSATDPFPRDRAESIVAAIEAEAYNDGVADQKLATLDAISADRARLAEEVRGLRMDIPSGWPSAEQQARDEGYDAALDAVIALIQPEGRGWREAARDLHATGDDEPYADDQPEGAKA